MLTYTGLAAPLYSPRPQERSGLAPANLLLRMAGLAALTAVFLVLGAARSHDTRAGSDAAVLAGSAERRGKDGWVRPVLRSVLPQSGRKDARSD
ncbi:MAG: hypothetical protein JWR27_2619 [Aeromicrobium sp.]|nr:hypothetical protein [Aeromicrobium sp.]